MPAEREINAVEALRAFVEACGGSPPDWLHAEYAAAELVLAQGDDVGGGDLFDRLHIEALVREWLSLDRTIRPSLVDGLVRQLRRRLEREHVKWLARDRPALLAIAEARGITEDPFPG